MNMMSVCSICLKILWFIHCRSCHMPGFPVLDFANMPNICVAQDSSLAHKNLLESWGKHFNSSKGCVRTSFQHVIFVHTDVSKP